MFSGCSRPSYRTYHCTGRGPGSPAGQELLRPGAGARGGGLCERPAGAAPGAHTGLLLNPYMSSSNLELEPEEEAYVRDLDLDPQRAAKPFFFTGVC